jgi:hypothetical protein
LHEGILIAFRVANGEYKLSVNDFVVKAAAQALVKVCNYDFEHVFVMVAKVATRPKEDSWSDVISESNSKLIIVNALKMSHQNHNGFELRGYLMFSWLPIHTSAGSPLQSMSLSDSFEAFIHAMRIGFIGQIWAYAMSIVEHLEPLGIGVLAWVNMSIVSHNLYALFSHA